MLWGRRVTAPTWTRKCGQGPCDSWRLRVRVNDLRGRVTGSNSRVAVLFLDRNALPTVARAARRGAACARSPHEPPAGTRAGS